MGIRREDFVEVKPTEDEKADWRRRYPSRSHPYRAEHKPCGTRIWYSGIAIGSHMRACKGPRCPLPASDHCCGSMRTCATRDAADHKPVPKTELGYTRQVCGTCQTDWPCPPYAQRNDEFGPRS